MDDFLAGKAGRNVDNPLVAASPVGKGSIFKLFYKSSVNHYMAQGQQIPFRRARRSCQLFIRITGINPN